MRRIIVYIKFASEDYYNGRVVDTMSFSHG